MALKKVTKADIDKAWETFDYNGNGILSLAEIDRAVIELYPHYSKNKPVLMRAYKAADASKDGFIDRKEFHRLMEFIGYYDEMYAKFKKLDTDGDRRVSFEEFEKGWKECGFSGNAKKKFEEIDVNKGGYVLFDEFCAALAKSKVGK